MYAAASPYGLNPAAAAGLMSPFAAAAAAQVAQQQQQQQQQQGQMSQAGQAGQSGTGNPLLDAYASHYAALAAGYGGINNQPAVTAASVMNGLDQSHQGEPKTADTVWLWIKKPEWTPLINTISYNMFFLAR